LGQALGQADVLWHPLWIALALVWALIGLVNLRIQSLELQPVKMKQLLITMSAVAAILDRLYGFLRKGRN